MATNAAIEPPTTLGNQRTLATTNVGQGNCASTVVTEVGGNLASWGTNAATLTPAVANSSDFGLVFSKLETSEVKVDAVCLEIEYLTDTGPAVTEECFAPPPPPEANELTIVKEVVGTTPGSDWDFDPDWDDPFTLPADIIAKINADMNKILGTPEMREVFMREGAEPATMTPEKFAQTIRDEIEGWKKVAKQADIKPES